MDWSLFSLEKRWVWGDLKAFPSVPMRKLVINVQLFSRYPAPELEDREGEQNEALIIQGEMVSNLRHHLDTHKSMGLGGIHPEVLMEMVEVLTKPLSIIYHQSWLPGEVPVDWRFANVTLIYESCQK
ncbi:rna-directed dna polymerase from mobile element hypothetical protein [Limosa lapponica baueri]|uniref:Rna-directed dna polymerase from mobile element jockey-like n=1 Tax=Limosa lapponica baueri TaxID=1758121 RepID=A0A2I0TYU5_LIMLA|nr:rna-directed dna polymerase from mobile element hypothetical protein [Limosa lapponica baueri]